MDLYTHHDYKDAIRQRVKELQSTRKSLTLKKLASQIPIQYTYLSKALNDDKTHLNEDHLFAVCRILQFYPEETDYLYLLRSHAVAHEPARKTYLFGKIERHRREKKLNADVQAHSSNRLLHEMGYLFDPIAAVVYVSLHIAGIQKDPRQLCTRLGLTPARLKDILKTLAELEFIELNEDGGTVKRILKSRIHHGQDHPLMRVHQSLLKTMVNSQLLRTPEEDKQSVLVTFTADEAAFTKVKEEFQAFLKKVEEVVGKSRDQHTYQMSFDLFKWF